MSSINTQTRYRTLVSHLAKVYAAEESARTVALHEGLDEIVAKIQPEEGGAWKQVKADSQRLLKVWMARETRPGDAELASQILDALDEFATDAAIVSAVAAVVVTPPEPTHAAEKKPTPVSIAVAPVAVTPVPVLIVEEKVVAHISKKEEVTVVDDEDEDEDEATITNEDEDEDEGEDEDTGDEEPAEEVVEPEEDEEAPAEEEEEGMDVEKKIFRGRAYWMDVNTNTLYAVVGDDDMGDEVGKVVDGRPVFLAATR